MIKHQFISFYVFYAPEYIGHTVVALSVRLSICLFVSPSLSPSVFPQLSQIKAKVTG